MKTNLFLGLAATALVLASCAQDDVIESAATSANNEIRINATIDGFSRSGEILSSTNPIRTFNLWASTVANNTPFIQDGVTRVGEGYEFDGTATKYWPQTEALNFYACNGGTFSDADKTIEYTVPAAAASHLDLMYASALGLSRDNNTNKAVDLSFKHALCQVELQALNTNPNITIEVEKVEIEGIANAGTFAFSGEKWTTGDAASFTAFTGTKELPATANRFYGSDKDDVMVLIPQKNTSARLAIDCTITDSKSGVNLYTGTTYINFPIDWQAAYKYTYTLAFGAGNAGVDDKGNPTLTTVSVTATTGDFTTAEGKTLEN